MSARGNETTAGEMDNGATVMHRRDRADIPHAGVSTRPEDATLVDANRDTERTLLSSDAIDQAFDILSQGSFDAAEESLDEGNWPEHAPPRGPVLEFKEDSFLSNSFIVETKLGEGGMGTLWKGVGKLKQEARDRNPYVAIKLLQGDFREHPEALIALQRESSKQQRLAHPNIATVYDFDRAEEAGIGSALETVIAQARDNQIALANEALQALERDVAKGSHQEIAKLTEARTAIASAYGRLSELVATQEGWGQALKLLMQGLALSPDDTQLLGQKQTYDNEYQKVRAVEDLKSLLSGSKPVDRAQLRRQVMQIKKDFPDKYASKCSGTRGACSQNMAGLDKRARASCWDQVSNSRGPTLVVVPAGNGIAKAFAIEKLEVSIADDNLLCRNASSCGPIAGDGKLPATGISVPQAQAYARWLSKNTGATYRLPTDFEWEHAANAGGRAAKSKNFNCTVVVSGQTLKGQSLRTAQAGKPNGWGLINYVGNAREWAKSSTGIVARGGAHTAPMSRCKVSLRDAHSGGANAVTGFQIMRELG